MRRVALSIAIGGAVMALLAGQAAYDTWHTPDGKGIVGTPIFCPTGKPREAVPCGGGPLAPLYVMSMPFVRATQDVNRFEGVSTTAKTFAIARPPGATSYRFVNPCDVPVRIRKVSSASEVIDRTQGTLFLQNTVETLGTSDPQFVSLIAMREPTGECTPELGYGNGG